jgi:signal transduction histidine kinase/HAMP domain-containing protein
MLALSWSLLMRSRASLNMDLVGEMRNLAFERIVLRDDYLLNRETRVQSQWHAKSEKLRRLLETASGKLTGREEQALLKEARANFDSTLSLFSKFMEGHEKRGGNYGKGVRLSEADSSLLNQVFLKAKALNGNINRLYESAQRSRTKARYREALVIFLSIFGGVVALLINSASINRIFTQRIAALSRGVEIIGAGDLNYRITIEGDDELSALAVASNEMAERLGRSYTSITLLESEIERRKRAEELIHVRLRLFEYSTGHTLEELLRKSLDMIGQLMDSPIGFYHFVEPDQKTISLQTWSTLTLERFCKAEGDGLHYGLDDAGVWVDCVRQRKPVIHNDYATLPNRKGLPEGHADVIRELVTPIIRHGKIVAIIGMGNKPLEYTEDDASRINFLADISWEIVERKRVEDALHESEKRLSEAQKMAQLGYWSWDVKSGRVEWSEEVYNIFHLDPDKFTPNIDSILALSPWPQENERDGELIRRAMESHEKGDYEQRFLRPDGSSGYYYSTFQGSYDEAGDLISIVGTVLDITERKKREKEVEEKNAELERFTYTVSHDLKSPLVTIKTFLGYLEQDILDADENLVARDIDFMHGAADKMAQLLNELLEMSRVGRVVNPPEHVSFGEIVKDALDAVAGGIAERGVEVKVDESAISLYGDRPRLMEIWQNLIENGIKYMGERESPLIEAGAETVGEETIFFVRDNGIGIDPRHKEKIFGLFEKLDPKSEGSGLGLALVKRIVAMYQGTIRVESYGPGKGACFRFTLPGAISGQCKGGNS